MPLYLPSNTAFQYHCVCFMPTYESNSRVYYNTWDDWYMIPTSDPFIAPSQVLTNYTDFEYWDGALDESEVLENKVYRQMISSDLEFFIDFDYRNKYNSIYELYTDILETLHGKEKLILLSTDMDVMYKGRVYVDSFDDSADGSNVTATIKCNVEPFIFGANNIDLERYYNNGTTRLVQMA